ncbi:MAG TPA: PDZ domain-containing protein, partial [Candidatus Angelobacter sp.]|nr:PDZ domain-containing protein [Candidatus Angelobacter sp.]
MLPRPRFVTLLDNVIFACLALFAIALPHSIKGAERAWKLALILWLAKLAMARVRPFKQPLAAPLLAYVLLSAISTLLSSEPLMSWDRMKFVCLFLVGIVVAQNLHRLSQVRWLAVLLVLSGFAAALLTGWQYTYGIGVLIRDVPPASALAHAGLQPGQIITSVAGRPVHSPAQLESAIRQLPPRTTVQVEYFEVMGNRPVQLTLTSDDFMTSGLGTVALPLGRGKPFRASGTLGHYVVFAEMLMQIGCLSWALFLVSSGRQLAWKLMFGAAFVAITAALFMTETRAAVAGLGVGCLIGLFLLGRGVWRVAAVAALIAVLAG